MLMFKVYTFMLDDTFLGYAHFYSTRNTFIQKKATDIDFIM